MILFWKGVATTNGEISTGWSIAEINRYYLFMVIAGSLLVSHVEEDIAEFDIREGRLTKYLIKPVSYYWFKFYEEIPYRVLQGFYGLLVLIGIFFLFGLVRVPVDQPAVLALALLTIALAYFLSFTFKMIIGLFSFWMTDIWGIYELTDIILVIMAGFVMPITLYPEWLEKSATLLPFSYMIYFPVMAIQGSYSLSESALIIIKQVGWLILLIGIYRLLWSRGLKHFTAVGH